MFWLYILVPLIILCGVAGVINRRRRRSISGSESTAELARARAETTWREGRLSRHCLPGGGQVIEAINTLEWPGQTEETRTDSLLIRSKISVVQVSL